MKKMLKTVLLASLLVPLTTHAAVLWSVTLDEYGNGTFDDGQTTISLTGQLIADPSGGISGLALVYTLPFQFPAASAGDYLVLEPPNTGLVSDVVRFWTPEGTVGNQVIFYSDFPDPDELPPIPPADTGLPTSYMQNVVTLLEGGIEGGYQAAVYTPISGDPGYIDTALVAYTFISDVPEPGIFAFAGMGLAGLFGLRRLLARS